MTPRNIAVTGVPRGGTTLACHLLDACDDTVALFEPMDIHALDPSPAKAIGQVDQFYSDTRHQLLASGQALSKHRDGTVPDNPFDEPASDGRRRLVVEHGAIHVGRPAQGFTLVIKHNAAFTALLPDLAARLECFAIVRNPLAVLASWNTVELPVSQGRVPAGEHFDAALRLRLDQTPERLARQVMVLEWFFARFRAHLPPTRVLRYEDVVATGGASLRQAMALTGAAREDLTPRNTRSIYRATPVNRLAEALRRQADPSWTRWYDSNAIADLAAALETPPA